jgi:hypothetical protein
MLIASVVLLAGLLTAGLVGTADRSVASAFASAVSAGSAGQCDQHVHRCGGLTVSVVALFHRPEDEGQALPHGGDHLHGLHDEVNVGALPTAAGGGTRDPMSDKSPDLRHMIMRI